MKQLLSLNNVSTDKKIFLMVLTTSYEGQRNVDVNLCYNDEDFRNLGYSYDEIETINNLNVDEEYVVDYYDGVSVKRIA